MPPGSSSSRKAATPHATSVHPDALYELIDLVATFDDDGEKDVKFEGSDLAKAVAEQELWSALKALAKEGKSGPAERWARRLVEDGAGAMRIATTLGLAVLTWHNEDVDSAAKHASGLTGNAATLARLATAAHEGTKTYFKALADATPAWNPSTPPNSAFKKAVSALAATKASAKAKAPVAGKRREDRPAEPAKPAKRPASNPPTPKVKKEPDEPKQSTEPTPHPSPIAPKPHPVVATRAAPASLVAERTPTAAPPVAERTPTPAPFGNPPVVKNSIMASFWGMCVDAPQPAPPPASNGTNPLELEGTPLWEKMQKVRAAFGK